MTKEKGKSNNEKVLILHDHKENKYHPVTGRYTSDDIEQVYFNKTMYGVRR